MADRYRKVRKALRDIEAHVKHVEATTHNRAERRRMFFGEKSLQLMKALKEAKRHV